MTSIQEKASRSDDGMATDKSSHNDEKAAVHHIDRKESPVAESEPEKALPAMRKVDYSGAYEKTDPKEIALVKKLDRWIMVCCVATNHL